MTGMRRRALGIVAWSLAVGTACGGNTSVTLGGDRDALNCSDTPAASGRRSGAMPMMLFFAEGHVVSLAADATHLYWIEVTSAEEGETHRLMRASLSTSVRETLATGSGSPNLSVALDETRVFWSQAATADSVGRIRWMTKDGSTSMLAYESQDFDNRSNLALDAKFIYFSEGDFVSRFGKEPGASGGRTVLHGDVRGVAVTKRVLYFTEYGSGFVGALEKDDELSSMHVLEYVDRPERLSLSCGRLVFSSDSDARKLYVLDPKSGRMRELGEVTSGQFAVDARYAYVGSQGELHRVALESGTREQLSSDTTLAEKLVAVNDTHVFWTSDESGGAIYALRK